MFKTQYSDVESIKVEEDGVSGVSMRWVISEKQGAENFALRVFTVEPGGNTPLHTHDWEHEVFVLKGNGSAYSDGEYVPMQQGDVIFIAPNELHQFKNTSDAVMEFICLIPIAKKCGC
jgi:quercetin dioxygenase-like cupin family protein